MSTTTRVTQWYFSVGVANTVNARLIFEREEEQLQARLELLTNELWEKTKIIIPVSNMEVDRVSFAEKARIVIDTKQCYQGKEEQMDSLSLDEQKAILDKLEPNGLFRISADLKERSLRIFIP
ncbi:hypothetical protein [Candidatus Neptunochlamydia vexilliferae]|uniref:Uncharacterized protein n=1 Tax=Candidatus Neptunichlamydia vexilliferae TaxID=1651774 RepID=A0ABS0AWV3_9BACT|nr:hypothetical protein [Candidatus Neptunochlamydia vexilliferae]MBF5058621.1 hypothetical protein [Candidatus Neptunochlamydia vexilliferae]